MLKRLPRLTLFTGPSCSLCDTAKHELAVVKAQSPFHLALVNIQDPDQQTWKRAYQYDIPVLHLEDKMVQKHRIDKTKLRELLEEWKMSDGEIMVGDPEKKEGGDHVGWGDVFDADHVSGPDHWGEPARNLHDPYDAHALDIFFADEVGSTELSRLYGYDSPPRYYRDFINVLGGCILRDILRDQSRPRQCFNCGSPYHQLRNCPDPKDRDLIALSKAVFLFDRDDIRPEGPAMKLTEWAERKQTRLRYLREFEPGQIRGAELRDALGLPAQPVEWDELPWYPSMLLWGYPPGWHSSEDPRLLIAENIENDGVPCDEDTIFLIHEEDECKTVLLPKLWTSASSLDKGTDQPKHRWASYRTGRFVSDGLPIAEVYAQSDLDNAHAAPGRKQNKASARFADGLRGYDDDDDDDDIL